MLRPEPNPISTTVSDSSVQTRRHEGHVGQTHREATPGIRPWLDHVVDPGEYRVGMESEFERITIDPDMMRGAPCIRGLRIPVATVLGQLAAGVTPESILEDFPDLEADDIPAALEYAAAAVQDRELPLTRPA